MKPILLTSFPVVIFVVLCGATYIYREPILELSSLVRGDDVISYIAYVALLTLAVVLMPITVMPLIPLASAVFGPLTTALLSIVGWTLGAVIAFLLSRFFGRPFLQKFVSLEKLDNITDKLPRRVRFLGIILLRNTLPVDIASYALGLTKVIGLFEYTLATIIGVTWFAFAFAYAGEALLTGDLPFLIELAGLSVIVFVVAWFSLFYYEKDDNK